LNAMEVLSNPNRVLKKKSKRLFWWCILWYISVCKTWSLPAIGIVKLYQQALWQYLLRLFVFAILKEKLWALFLCRLTPWRDVSPCFCGVRRAFLCWWPTVKLLFVVLHVNHLISLQLQFPGCFCLFNLTRTLCCHLLLPSGVLSNFLSNGLCAGLWTGV
jgi:hypothetical protein